MKDNGTNNKTLKIIGISYVVLCFVITLILFVKHPICDFEILIDSSKIGVKTDFRPYAGVILMDEHDLEKCMEFYEERLILEDIEGILDFESNMYLIVYGAKIKSLHWSFKSTLFNNIEAPYSKVYIKGKKLIKIEYQKPDGNIYVYKMGKDPTLDL